MTKSRGTGISPLRYLDIGMNPEWLRYYIAAKLNANVEDIDFNPDDFIARVNSDLVGKYVNIASRAARFIAKLFGGELAGRPATARSVVACRRRTLPADDRVGERIRRSREVRHARCARIMDARRRSQSRLRSRSKPWELAKDPATALTSCSDWLHRALLIAASSC